jgi:hypothetical protein
VPLHALLGRNGKLTVDGSIGFVALTHTLDVFAASEMLNEFSLLLLLDLEHQSLVLNDFEGSFFPLDVQFVETRGNLTTNHALGFDWGSHRFNMYLLLIVIIIA